MALDETSPTGDARLTFLINPDSKKAFERLCAAQDLTVSQVLRRLIADQLERAQQGRAPPAVN